MKSLNTVFNKNSLLSRNIEYNLSFIGGLSGGPNFI